MAMKMSKIKDAGMGFCLALGFMLGNNAIAFADSPSPSYTPKSPIPPVTTGVLELVEIKPAAAINVVASRSRVFRTKGKIKRVMVSDPTIAEVVVVSEREFVLLGKRDGAVSVVLWFEDGTKSESPII